MLNVLVVDDEQILLRVLERLLKTRSFEVRTAKNVPDALEITQQFKPDILVTDLNLNADQDGLDLCRAFAQNPVLAGARRILISGQAGQLNGQGTLFDVFLAKPFTSQEFLKVLEQVITPPFLDEKILAQCDNSR